MAFNFLNCWLSPMPSFVDDDRALDGYGDFDAAFDAVAHVDIGPNSNHPASMNGCHSIRDAVVQESAHFDDSLPHSYCTPIERNAYDHTLWLNPEITQKWGEKFNIERNSMLKVKVDFDLNLLYNDIWCTFAHRAMAKLDAIHGHFRGLCSPLYIHRATKSLRPIWLSRVAILDHPSARDHGLSSRLVIF